MTTIIQVHLRDGRTICGRADFGKGSPANPFTYQEVADKFRGCAELARWPADKTERVISLVAGLDDLPNLERTNGRPGTVRHRTSSWADRFSQPSENVRDELRTRGAKSRLFLSGRSSVHTVC